MPVEHPENFPVASWLLPARMRQPVEAIYHFARAADDFADEGDFPDAERLARLDHFRRGLDAIEAGSRPAHPVLGPLADAVAAHSLPLGPLRELLDAFSQDVVKKRYETIAELMDYCRRSADPVGRLMLALFGHDAPRDRAESDCVCSGLQLANHWQDVAIDWGKGRVYLPREDLDHFGVDESQIAAGRTDTRWRDLMAFQCERARGMLDRGSPLGARLPGRVGMEVRAIVAGGLCILDRIDAVAGDVFTRRPRIEGLDWARVFWRGMVGLRSHATTTGPA